MLRRHAHGFSAGNGLDHFVVRRRQEIDEDLPVVLVVIDDQDARAHDRETSGEATSGAEAGAAARES